ncbi:MAG: YlzJ-like family protein [Halanaerobiales bacterium]|nr:YlzJ-like family protein [Halanaerobiales bacterium]
MLYSIIPSEMVFDEWDGKELENYREITFENRQFIVEPLEDNQARIVQLVSSDPNDFINLNYWPGTIIKFSL